MGAAGDLQSASVVQSVMAAVNAGRPVHRTLVLRAHDLLVATNRETSGDGYQRLRDAFERLAGETPGATPVDHPEFRRTEAEAHRLVLDEAVARMQVLEQETAERVADLEARAIAVAESRLLQIFMVWPRPGCSPR